MYKDNHITEAGRAIRQFVDALRPKAKPAADTNEIVIRRRLATKNEGNHLTPRKNGSTRTLSNE
jgi:hypothetical protein